MGISGGPDMIQDGLVLALDASDRNSYPGSGTVWSDMSGNGNTGTLTNGPTFNTGNGGYINFDGSDDYIVHSSIDTGTSGAWGMWVRYNALAAVPVLLGANIINYYMLFYDWSTKYFYINYGGTLGSLSYPTGLSADVWYHLWYTRSGNTHTVYLNGSSVGTMNVVTANTCKFAIIGAERTNAYFSNIRVASVGVYNRALSATEILQNYNALKSRFNL